MTSRRYGHGQTGQGSQDQAERKDEGWRSRQGGSQSRNPGRRGDDQSEPAPAGNPSAGTNTQGGLTGIREAAERERARIDAPPAALDPAEQRERERLADPRVSEGTPEHPRHARMPHGDQSAEERGSGAGGYDMGVDASRTGAPYQGARPEEAPASRPRGGG